MNHWLISALGAGWGHVNRAIALGRQLAQTNTVHILTNSPYADWIQSQLPLVAMADSLPMATHLQVHPLVNSSIEQVRKEVEAIALSQPWTGIIVDTFARGLVGEWADLWPKFTPKALPHHRILIQRDLNPNYLRAKQVPAFIHQHYDHIFLPGEGIESSPAPPAFPTSPPLPIASLTHPWLMRNATELPHKKTVRLNLSIPETPLIVVCAAGHSSELEFFGVLTQRVAQHFAKAHVRCLAFDCPPHCPSELWIRYWPGMDLLHLADVVIGGGGYNTVYECVALGLPLVAFSFPRRYDRQARRIQRYGYLVKTVEAAIATTQKLLAQPHPPVQTQRDGLTYKNGVCQAIQILNQRLL